MYLLIYYRKNRKRLKVHLSFDLHGRLDQEKIVQIEIVILKQSKYA